MLSGRDALASIDDSLAKMRREAEALDGQFQRTSAEFAKVRQQQLGIFTRLARIRMEEIERGELLQSLDDTERRVRDILAARHAAQESLAAEIAEAERALEARERERAEQQRAVDAAAEALDAAEAAAQQRLAADEQYQAELAAAQASDAVADQAEAKAQSAEADRLEKGKPYEADPVFSYLWRRGYGTHRYRAWPLARFLDRWVAHANGYEAMRRNYALLTDIPKRLEAHAARMREAAEADLADLREMEQRAAAAAGVPERQRELAEAERRLAELDEAVEKQQAAVDALMEKRGRFVAGEDEYSNDAARVLAKAFEREDFQTLRSRAARTRSEEDDRLVEELEALEDERERLREELVQYRRLHQAQRERLLGLEDVRRRFKESRYDDVHSVFVNGAVIALVLQQFLGGAVGTNDVWEAIRKQQRYRRIGADPVFGTGRFPRAPFPSPWRMPGGGRWNFPRGGGFGGGGFGRGGGFGGGGFRTGGGF
ncbi:MAG TPA: hypothetical protein VF322_14585 [Gammaproteobacteria bacterium]